MAAIALAVGTKFTATDKFSATMKKMTMATTNFGRKTVATFQKISFYEKKVRNGFQKLTGKIGQLGLAFGGLAIATTVATANIDLDASLQSLQAITGVTGEAFKSFAAEIDKVSKSQNKFAGDTAKAFEVVGSAQPILLKNAELLSKVTDSAITLSKAGLMPIEDSAKSLTGTMNQFGLDAEHADRVINLFSAGAKEGSANIRLLSESFNKVGAVAKDSNLTLEQTGAALELMSKFELKGAEAGISLKSTLLRLKSAQLGFKSGQFVLNDALEEFNIKLAATKDPIKKAALEEKVFGKVHILTGKILTQNISELNRLTDVMSDTNEATKQAAINSFSFKNLLDEISASFRNVTTTTDGNNATLLKLKGFLKSVADNMEKIISVTLTVIKVFLAYKAIMIGFNIVMTTYNIVTKAVTAAQWLWNAAMTANPIGLIIVGIGLLIAGVVLLIKNWKNIVTWVKESDNVFAKLIRFSLTPIIFLFKMIKKGWLAIKEAFSSGKIGEGIRKIGRSLLSFLLKPLELILKAANKITFGKVGGEALGKIQSFRSDLTNDNAVENLNPDATRESLTTQRIEQTKKEKIELSINSDKNISVDKNTSSMPVNLSSTMGWAGQ